MLLWASPGLSLGNHWKRPSFFTKHQRKQRCSQNQNSFRSLTYSSIAVTLSMWLSLISLAMFIKHYLPFDIVWKLDEIIQITHWYPPTCAFTHMLTFLPIFMDKEVCKGVQKRTESEHLGFAGHLVSVTSTQPSVKAAIEMHRWMSHPML